MNFEIVEATVADKDFILEANKQIDIVSDINFSALKDNVVQDLFLKSKAVCLIAKHNDVRMGMVLFSKVYWADRGEGVYVSQGYVEKAYRNKGVFKSLLRAAFEFYAETKFITLLVANDNIVMQASVKKLGFEKEEMLSYVVNKSDFDL